MPPEIATVEPSALGDALKGVSGTIARELPGAIAESKNDRAVVRGASVEAADTIDRGMKQREGMRPPPTPPPSPPPQYQESSMTDKWGGLAMGMAMLGSAMTRRPAIASMNAAAGVLNAYADSDAAAYKRNFDHWKATTDYSLKMYEYERDAYRDALSNIKENTSDAMAKVRVLASAFNDDALKNLAAIGNVAGVMAKIDEYNARLPELRTASERAKVEGELLKRFNVNREILRKDPTNVAALSDMHAIDAESKRFKLIGGGAGSTVDQKYEEETALYGRLKSEKETSLGRALTATEDAEARKQAHAAFAGTAGTAPPKPGSEDDIMDNWVKAFTAREGRPPDDAEMQTRRGELKKAESTSSEHVSTSHPFEIIDADGKVVRQFSGQESTSHAGLPSDINTGKPPELNPGETVRKAPPGSEGRQQATQLTAIRGAGLQAVAALQNLVELPIASNLGATMGTQFKTPDDMAAALRRSAVRKLTGSEARKVYISFLGVGRNLATLEAQGRATGLVGLSEQMTALAPQVGDDPLVNLRIYAEIRQIIDQSIKNAKVSHKQTPEMEALYDGILKDTHTAVPYTVHDVNELERDMSERKGVKRERARDFAEKIFANQGRRPLSPTPAPAGSAPAAGAAPSLPSEQPPTEGVAEGSLWREGPGGKVIGILRGGKWVAP